MNQAEQQEEEVRLTPPTQLGFSARVGKEFDSHFHDPCIKSYTLLKFHTEEEARAYLEEQKSITKCALCNTMMPKEDMHQCEFCTSDEYLCAQHSSGHEWGKTIFYMCPKHEKRDADYWNATDNDDEDYVDAMYKGDAKEEESA